MSPMQFHATRRSASTILSRDAMMAGMMPATRPMMALMPTPSAALAGLTPNTGTNPPLIPSVSPFDDEPAPGSAPMQAADDRHQQPFARDEEEDRSAPGSPSVRITAISVVRSRTDIAIVFAATNSVVMTTASAMLPSSRFRLPNIDANELWNCFSVSVLVSYGVLANC